MFISSKLHNRTWFQGKILGLLIILASLCSAQGSDTYEKSIVMILTVSQDYDYVTPWKKSPMSRSVGSGFIIEGNRILTNAHNVSNQRYIEVKKQNLARRYPAQVLFAGHDCDLAILTVDDSNFFEGTVPLQFGGLPTINSTVQTYGFPIGGQQISITEGVVSRLETSIYSHSQAAQHLVVQTDAAINPGNSGGPVLQEGKVVGVAFQGLQSADNIGYMIPTTVIAHFLKDIEDGTYHGFGMLGISLFPGLHNPGYKRYLRIPDEQDGVVVTNVLVNSTSWGILETGDVIIKIDDFNVDNDGRIMIDGLSLELTEIMDRKQIGQTLLVNGYRKGQPFERELVIAANKSVLPWNRLYDTKPDYRIFAGLTFVQLNRNFLETWGRNWVTEMPFELRYLFMESNTLNKSPDRKEYIVLSEILPDEVNAYLAGFKNQVVESVNGLNINELADLDKAFNQTSDGFWIVKFLNNNCPMVINSQQAKQREKLIFEKYQIPTDKEAAL
ncbi:MAG TPA: trypsin-like peptidase domain-containing protein [Anaerohalosphaeraceae bacterium]|nr:trypsin-like peptidase domain-containing protein [Anaerohalosphaeraceae bacterium]